MGLPWIQVDKAFLRSQQAIALGAALGVGRAGAVVLCCDFWAWASDNAPDGIICGAKTARAAAVVDEVMGAMPPGAPSFSAAMLDVGLLKPCAEGIRIAGWDRYAKALEKGAKDAKKKRDKRAPNARRTRAERGGELDGDGESDSTTPLLSPPASQGDNQKTSVESNPLESVPTLHAAPVSTPPEPGAAVLSDGDKAWALLIDDQQRLLRGERPKLTRTDRRRLEAIAAEPDPPDGPREALEVIAAGKLADGRAWT